jgi:phosphate-selective porin OprO/OprP
LAEVQNTVTNLAANEPRSAFGVRSNDDRYWAGVYLTGPQAGATHVGTNTQQLGGTARFTYQVLQGSNYSLHLGADGEYVFQPRANGAAAAAVTSTVTFSDRPELRVDPTAFLNTGQIPATNAGAMASRRQPATTVSSSRASTIESSLTNPAFPRQRRSRS